MNNSQRRFLEIVELTKVYRTRGEPAVVVNGFNLTAACGEFVCLIGHSGCGKSTVLSMIAGLSEISDEIDGVPADEVGLRVQAWGGPVTHQRIASFLGEGLTTAQEAIPRPAEGIAPTDSTAEDAAGATGEVFEPHEPMGERQPGGASVQLLLADRFPELVDRADRVVRDRLDRELEMLGPEPEPRVARQLRVVGDDIHLGVVEQ